MGRSASWKLPGKGVKRAFLVVVVDLYFQEIIVCVCVGGRVEQIILKRTKEKAGLRQMLVHFQL